METQLYNIGLFDDHPLMTDGLKTLLQTNEQFCIKLTNNSKETLLESLKNTPLDVLVLDVVAPDVNGLELFKIVANDYPNIKVIAYTTLTSVVLIENLLINGVKAYINKRQNSSEILAAILDVCHNKMYVPEQYQFLLKKERKITNPISLSTREQEVLDLILDGKLSKEIAELLSISKNTVENHRTNLFKKFQVSNLAELFKQAIRLGYSQD